MPSRYTIGAVRSDDALPTLVESTGTTTTMSSMSSTLRSESAPSVGSGGGGSGGGGSSGESLFESLYTASGRKNLSVFYANKARSAGLEIWDEMLWVQVVRKLYSDVPDHLILDAFDLLDAEMDGTVDFDGFFLYTAMSLVRKTIIVPRPSKTTTRDNCFATCVQRHERTFFLRLAKLPDSDEQDADGVFVFGHDVIRLLVLFGMPAIEAGGALERNGAAATSRLPRTMFGRLLARIAAEWFDGVRVQLDGGTATRPARPVPPPVSVPATPTPTPTPLPNAISTPLSSAKAARDERQSILGAPATPQGDGPAARRRGRRGKSVCSKCAIS